MPQPTSRLNFPDALTDLQALNDFQHVRCVGRASPLVDNCADILDPNDEIFRLAVEKLQGLSKSGLSAVNGLDEGLIRTLQDIARGFSCRESHRKMKAQREQIPYYWIALYYLPSYQYCMGFIDQDTPIDSLEKQDAIRSVIDHLRPDELWTLDKAMKQLDFRKEQKLNRRNDAVATFFLALIAEKLDQDGNENEKLRKHKEAQERWKRWHLVNKKQRLQWNRLLERTPGDDIVPESILHSEGQQTNTETHDHSQSAPVTPLKDPLETTEPPERPETAPQATQPYLPPRRDMRTPTKGGRKSPKASPSAHTRTKTIQRQAGSPRIRSSRRTSSTASTVQQAQAFLVQHAQAQRQDTASGGYFGTQPEKNKPNDGTLSTDMMTGALEDPDRLPSSMRIPPDYLQSPTSDPTVVPKAAEVMFAVSEVFKLMKKPLKAAKESKGHIYALTSVEHTGYIKIGYSETNVEMRKARIESCIGADLEHLDHRYIFPVSNYKRVEQLIHTALKPHQRTLQCDKFGCREGHGEWFAVDKQKALSTIERWKRWMNTKPYSNCKLIAGEELRIDEYNTEVSMAKLILKNNEGNNPTDWDWDTFMKHSRWYLQLIHHFSRERPEKNNTRSLWTSLQKDWESHVIFYLVVFFFSSFMFAVADYTPSSLASAHRLGLVNMLFLGSMGVWYAA